MICLLPFFGIWGIHFVLSIPHRSVASLSWGVEVALLVGSMVGELFLIQCALSVFGLISKLFSTVSIWLNLIPQANTWNTANVVPFVHILIWSSAVYSIASLLWGILQWWLISARISFQLLKAHPWDAAQYVEQKGHLRSLIHFFLACFLDNLFFSCSLETFVWFSNYFMLLTFGWIWRQKWTCLELQMVPFSRFLAWNDAMYQSASLRCGEFCLILIFSKMFDTFLNLIPTI
jgi:hypothetical protein